MIPDPPECPSLFPIEPCRTSAALPNENADDDLQYFPTPSWLAEAMIERMAPAARDVVTDPACGDGAILALLDPQIRAFGVEADPDRARRARARCGYPIITGDFRDAPFPLQPTLAIANPPFRASLIHALLERLYQEFPPGGRAGMLIPAHFLSFVSTIDTLRARWSIDYVLAPRDGFPRITFALCFATFVKEEARRLSGFAFVEDALNARHRLAKRFRRLLDEHRGGGSPWDAPIEEALRLLGGAARPAGIIAVLAVTGHPLTESFKGKIRQRLQLSKRFTYGEDERWRLAA